MFVIKKMRLNKFEATPIVSNRELFIAKGESRAVVTSKETADCYDTPSIVGASKTKALGLASEISIEEYKHKNGKPNTETLNKSTKDL